MAYSNDKRPRKKGGLSDEAILSKVEAQEKECVGWSDSKLSRERTRVTKYYNGELPAQQHKGTSSYRSSDVYDSVEAMKNQIVETFCGNGEDIITFPPQNEQDVDAANDATAYCAYMVHRRNDFEGMAHDVVHDGLTARIGIVKVYWEDDHEDEDHEFENASYEDVQGLGAQDDIAELEAEETGYNTGIFNGTFTRRIDRSKVCIDPVPLEEIAISSRALRDIERADTVSHKTIKDKAELKALYPNKADKINDLPADASELTSTEEAVERTSQAEGTVVTGGENVEPELNKHVFHETYTKLNIGKGLKRYKVCHASHLLLDIQEVDRLPFKVFVPLPRPHTLWGNNFGDRIIATQNARTVLTRGVLDHTVATTNPRYQVSRGGLLNPKELLDNRFGGIVNVRSQDAVKPFDQANLNPFILNVLEMLKSNKEEQTGISALSQGLNKDAVSSQNSQGLIENLVTLSQQRQKMIARNFAKFLVDVYLEVYRLILENEKGQRTVEITHGSWEKFDPAQWVERSACRVSVNLGYGERDRRAAKYASAYAQMAQDPILGPVFGLKERVDMAKDTMKLMGFDKTYLGDPNTAQQPGPDPLKVKELEIKDKLAEAALITAKATETQKTADAQFKAMSAKLDQITKLFQMKLDAHESERLDAETTSRINVAQREIKLAEEAPPESTNTIVSANG